MSDPRTTSLRDMHDILVQRLDAVKIDLMDIWHKLDASPLTPGSVQSSGQTTQAKTQTALIVSTGSAITLIDDIQAMIRGIQEVL